MLKIIMPISSLVSLCLLIILLSVTTPAAAGPFGVLTVFILAYILSFGLITFTLYFISRTLSHLAVIFITRKPIDALSLRESSLFSSIISAAPIMLIGLKSVGEIGFPEYLLVLIFVIIGCLYISKRIR
jgi:hypothetical protein